jgi:hypothetical protein
MKFTVTVREDDVDAYNAEAAAVEVARRLANTLRPIVFDVTPVRGSGPTKKFGTDTVSICVSHGVARRIAG